MRRLFLSLLLPQLFLALSVGSVVTTCEAASAFGMEFHHEDSHCHLDHSHDEEVPRDGGCGTAIVEATTPSSVKIPTDLAPVDLAPGLNFSVASVILMPTLSPEIPRNPAAPPSPPRPPVTGCFLI